MLQLQVKQADVCKVSKLLYRFPVKAEVTEQEILLDGDFSDEMITKLCELIKIQSFGNFESTCVSDAVNPVQIECDIKSEKSVEDEGFLESCEDEASDENEALVDVPVIIPNLPNVQSEYDLIYSEVKRGEVYVCDLGNPYGSEQGEERPVVVVQNDTGNLHSPTTIVIPFTTATKNKLPTHLEFYVSNDNITDYDSHEYYLRRSIIMAEQIMTVDKTRLRKYCGTLSDKFMQKLQECIDISLDLKPKVETFVKEKVVYVDKFIPKEIEKKTPQRIDINPIQIKLLSLVNPALLLEISDSKDSDFDKAYKILELFGFDFEQNGVSLILKAIIASPKDAYFNVETLSETVSKEEGIPKEEVMRLIVARVKERFGFKKAPTVDFIRLVNSFLTKQEEE